MFSPVKSMLIAVGAREEPVDDVHAVLQLAFGRPHRELHRGLGEAGEVVDHDEALHAQPALHDVGHVHRARRRLGVVVARDHPARDDPAEVVHVSASAASRMSPPTLSKYTSIPLGHATRKRVGDVTVLVVDALVEAELVDHPAALLLSCPRCRRPGSRRSCRSDPRSIRRHPPHPTRRGSRPPSADRCRARRSTRSRRCCRRGSASRARSMPSGKRVGHHAGRAADERVLLPAEHAHHRARRPGATGSSTRSTWPAPPLRITSPICTGGR